ncbi:MAG: hypothetical protein LBL66_03380 [Clostridiales bacterium]|jgi:hypothetical protein|nr:hypothetical protein [Clostridiales bacterium]
MKKIKHIALFLSILLAVFATACTPSDEPPAGGGGTGTPPPGETQLPGDPVTADDLSEWATAFAKLDNFTAGYAISLALPSFGFPAFPVATGEMHAADNQFLLNTQTETGFSDLVYADGSGVYVNGDAFGQQSVYYPFPELPETVPDAAIPDGLSFDALFETLLSGADMSGIRKADGWYTTVSPVNLKPYLDTVAFLLTVLGTPLPFTLPADPEIQTFRFQIADGALTAVEIGLAATVDAATVYSGLPSTDVPVVIGLALNFSGYGTTEIEKPDWATALDLQGNEE